MPSLKFHKSDKERICRLCEKPIDKGKTSIMIENCKVGNKKVNLHFHCDCLYKGLQQLGEQYEFYRTK
jgi:hypothetical protein